MPERWKALRPSTGVATSDADALRRSEQDPEVFGLLFDRHGSSVYRFIARRRGPQVADDLLAEVFAQAFAARARFDPSVSLSALPWLYGIALNLARADMRATVRHSRALERLGAGSGDVDPYDEADDRVDAQAKRRLLRQALDLVPEADREVLLLVAWEGLSPAAAEAALSIPAGTARSRLHMPCRTSTIVG